MAMTVMFPAVNNMLADPTSPDYARAAAAVAQATSCRAAFEQLDLLAGQPPEVVREAAAVFAAMPTEVDQGILSALRAGFGRRSPMKLHWDEHKTEGDPTVAHRVDEQDGSVQVHIIAPKGDRFL
jgi:hypothetical protein